MLNFRQMQARKSILVRVAENNIDDLKNFCTRYVNINKMFCYNTVNNKVSIFCNFYFILVDLKIITLNIYLNNYMYYIFFSVLY